MNSWGVLIVEDDEMVASIHRRIVVGHPGFHIVALAKSSEEAHALIKRGVAVDLILLDVELPGADGIALLRSLRARGGPEVIAVTASCDPTVVKSLFHLGVVDYLVKPFAIERLQESLVRFRERSYLLSHATSRLEQTEIDTLCSQPERWLLPKGIKPETLELIRNAVSRNGAGFSSAEDIAQQAFVARVTARRYLEYLVTANQVEMLADSDGPGRPRKLYRRRDLVSA